MSDLQALMTQQLIPTNYWQNRDIQKFKIQLQEKQVVLAGERIGGKTKHFKKDNKYIQVQDLHLKHLFSFLYFFW